MMEAVEGQGVTSDGDHAVAGDHAARRILLPQDIDRLGEAVLALTSEVWVLTDRLIVIEAILEAKGMDLRTAIEDFVPTPECERVLAARREKLINAVVGALKA